jgi:hypothetical protein
MWLQNSMGLGWNSGFGTGFNWLPLLAIWSLGWKGLALWRAAKRDEKYWYLAILILNTMGILPILYLLTWGKEDVVVKKTKKK